MRRVERALAVALLLALCAAHAQQAEWNLAALMQALAARPHAQARFVERRYLKVLDAPLEVTGRLVYAAPDRLEKHMLTPKRETLRVVGDRVTIEGTDRVKVRTLRLQDHPALWGFVQSVRATLAGDLPALERFYAVELHGTRARWELVLAPRVQVMRALVDVIRIRGSEARIRTVEVVEARGDRAVMQIREADS
ncbi:MAG TPA: LolA-related protein [Burkholderiales bacterium]|jgi:hypothetical protein|nr:LolA-related protein [Burkholderiales bacterium]